MSRPRGQANHAGLSEALPLTRSVVQYRSLHELHGRESRIQDIGLALVLEGRYPACSEVVDLGSGEVKVVDLSRELVLLDWISPMAFGQIEALVARVAEGDASTEMLRQRCFDTAIELLERTGFGPITRSTLLRIGFRDVCQDLDLHEGASVRLIRDSNSIVRAYLDPDLNALLFRSDGPDHTGELEECLMEAFPTADLIEDSRGGERDQGARFQVRFPLAADLAETRRSLRTIRLGLLHLLARFEPARHRTTENLLRTFGVRDSLRSLEVVEPRAKPVSLRAAPRTTSSYLH